MPNQKKQNITIWTDGSCLKNPGVGGWGCIIDTNDYEYEISSSCANTTNNQMELTAIIRGLEYIDRLPNDYIYAITIMSDSNYCVCGINDWINKWVREKNPSQRLNWNLWKKLYELKTSLNETHSLEFKWVKAHSSSVMNNRVDILARTRATELQNFLKS